MGIGARTSTAACRDCCALNCYDPGQRLSLESLTISYANVHELPRSVKALTFCCCFDSPVQGVHPCVEQLRACETTCSEILQTPFPPNVTEVTVFQHDNASSTGADLNEFFLKVLSSLQLGSNQRTLTLRGPGQLCWELRF